MKKINQENLTKGYVAGFIDNSGGFYIRRFDDAKRPYPRFKIRTKEEDMIDLLNHIRVWFRKNEGIKFNISSTKNYYAIKITKIRDMIKFVRWFEENCHLEKKNFKEVKVLSEKIDEYLKSKKKNYRSFFEEIEEDGR